MKVQIKQTVEKDACFLKVSAGVRWWDDAEVDGVQDGDDLDLIPCRIDERWFPTINIDTGVIENWTRGKTAKIHYKVCDDFMCTVLDSDLETIFTYDGYVPKIMCPSDDGYGDYIIMEIDENGMIADWDKEKIHELLKYNEDND